MRSNGNKTTDARSFGEIYNSLNKSEKTPSRKNQRTTRPVLFPEKSFFVEFKKTNSNEEILSSRSKVENESEKTNESSENQQDIELDHEGERYYDSVPTSLNHSESGKRYAAEETASAIGVKVEHISRDEMPEGHKNAKGMWKDGKIYIALENHPDANDVRRTVLHEAVGHDLFLVQK